MAFGKRFGEKKKEADAQDSKKTDDAVVAPTGPQDRPQGDTPAPDTSKILDSLDDKWEERRRKQKEAEGGGTRAARKPGGPPIKGGPNSGKEEGWFS